MKKDKIKFKIDSEILNNYVDVINSFNGPMSELKKQLGVTSSLEKTQKFLNNNSFTEKIKSVDFFYDKIKKISKEYPNEKAKIFTDTIKQIMDTNNGMLFTRMIEPLNISRQYLSVLEKENIIKRISRGIYISSNAYEDSYFSFQQKYKKAIFSHMNALYFYGMTEEFPYNYTVTVPQRYHVDIVNEKCNVFYVSDEIYELGIVEVMTPSGNKVKAYDKERCICDIIKSRGRMDFEQIKKAIKEYMKSNDKDLAKLSEYSKKMGINEKVMEIVGGAYYY